MIHQGSDTSNWLVVLDVYNVEASLYAGIHPILSSAVVYDELYVLHMDGKQVSKVLTLQLSYQRTYVD